MTTLNDKFPTNDVDDVLHTWIRDLIGSTFRSDYSNTETLSATRVLLDLDTPIQRFDCNGANRIVKMPSADAINNHPYLVFNATSSGSWVLTMQNNGGTTTYTALSPNCAAVFFPDGSGGYVPVWSGAIAWGDFVEQGSAPGTPTSGKWRLYFKSDGLYIKDDAGAETGPLGTGSGSASIDAVTPYKIVASVSSNNLTVAIKDKDGNDPSVSSPVRVQIAGIVREVTAALSLTLNAGTNFFDAGSTAHNAQDIDFPVQLIWRAASSEVLLGLSRGFGNIYSDFSSTSTDPYYLAYSGSAPASTDVIENIGSINASLSATPSFGWSIPATPVINHKPIVATRVMTWNPNPTGYSSAPTANFARYQVRNDKKISMNYRMAVGGATSNSTSLTFTLPFRAKTITNALWQVLCNVINNGVASTTPGRCAWSSGATSADVYVDSASGAWNSSGEKRIGGMQVTEYEY